MNLKLSTFNKIIALVSAATMLVGSIAPAGATKGRKRQPAHNAKRVKLANKGGVEIVDASTIHQIVVDNILNEINSIEADLAYAISEYYNAKDFEPKNQCIDKSENELEDYFDSKKSTNILKTLLEQKKYTESLNKLKNDIKMSENKYNEENDVFTNCSEHYKITKIQRQAHLEVLSKLQDKIRTLKNEYNEKYNALLQELQTLKACRAKFLEQSADGNVIDSQINMLRDKIISNKTTIYRMNANFALCGLYDFLTKSNVNGIIGELSDENSICFYESLQAINVLNSQLEKAVSNPSISENGENVSSFLNDMCNNFETIYKNFENLNLNSKIQISLKLLNMKNLLNIIDKNFKIYENNHNIINLLDKAKNTISDYIYEFFRFSSINYMNDEDINNYLPIFADNERIYNSKSIYELEQSIFDIFKLTNKNFFDHEYSKMINLLQNSEQTRSDACRLVVSNLKISIMNILGRLDNRLNLDKNSILKIADDLEKVVQNIKSFNMRFNNDQGKNNLNLLCDSLKKANLKLKELKNEMEEMEGLKNNMNMEYDKDKLCSIINSIYFELDRILTQEIDNVFKLKK